MSISVRQAILFTIIAVAGVLLLASTSVGQCSMCRTTLAGANNALFIRNFNLGVLVLLVPPVTIFCSIFVALKRYKNNAGSSRQSSVSSPPPVEHDDQQRELSE